MEAFFLQKRFLLSALKPELVINNDISDLRLELGRKEELLKRHYEKISHWQNMLADVQGWAKSPAQGPTPSALATGSSIVSSTSGMAPQQTPGGPQTPNSMGVGNMSNTLQQVSFCLLSYENFIDFFYKIVLRCNKCIKCSSNKCNKFNYNNRCKLNFNSSNNSSKCTPNCSNKCR